MVQREIPIAYSSTTLKNPFNHNHPIQREVSLTTLISAKQVKQFLGFNYYSTTNF